MEAVFRKLVIIIESCIMKNNNKILPANGRDGARYLDLMSAIGFGQVFQSERGLAHVQLLVNALFAGSRRFSNFEVESDAHYWQFPKTLNGKKSDLLCRASPQALIMLNRRQKRTAEYNTQTVEGLATVVANWKLLGKKGEFKSFVSINLVDFVIWEGTAECLHSANFSRAAGGYHEEDIVNLTVELPKFKKSITELVSELDKWLFLLKNMKALNRRPPVYNTPLFKELFSAARIH